MISAWWVRRSIIAVTHAALGKMAPPVLEGEVGGQEDRAPLVAAADHLEQEVGGLVVEGRIPDLIHEEQARLNVVPEPPLQGPGRPWPPRSSSRSAAVTQSTWAPWSTA